MKILNHVFALLIALALSAAMSGCATKAAKAPTPIPMVIENQPVHVIVDNQAEQPTQAPARFGAARPSQSAAQPGQSSIVGTATGPNVQVTAGAPDQTPVASPPMLLAPATGTAQAAPVGGGDNAAIDLSKESLQAGKMTVSNGSVLLRKTVVTNIVQVPVPVRREEYEVVHVPVPQNAPASAFETKQIQMDLSKEVPTGQITSQLVDRVELRKVIKTDQPIVSGQVRTENVEVVPTPAPKQ